MINDNDKNLCAEYDDGSEMTDGISAAERAVSDKKRGRIIAASLGCAAAAICFTACGSTDQMSDSSKPADTPSTVTSVADRGPQSSAVSDTDTAEVSVTDSVSQDDSSAAEEYVPDIKNVFGSDYYTFNDNYSEIHDYDYDLLLSSFPEACTAVALSRGTSERLNIRSIQPEDRIYLYATTNVEQPLADAVRNSGLTLPKYENGFLGNEYWDYVEFTACYDPDHNEALKAEFTGSMLIDKKNNIELKMVKEFVPKGTGGFVIDHIGAKTYDLTEKYKTLGSRGSIFGKYNPEVYENAKGISFIVTPVTLSYMDSKTDVTDLENVGYIACYFANDGCVVISAENRDLYTATEFPDSIAMISKKEFLKILDEIKEDYLKS